ncbi:MAG TPA: hypothetical protein VFV78_09175 [Vicinamibacterales bacterium]|nr:hypothetical protein [Vicinamibacterales bacterium]
MFRQGLATTVFGLIAAVALSAGSQTFSKTDADSLQRKLDAILKRGAATGKAVRPLSTSVSDREFNAYFRFQGAEKLPAGVLNPTLQILDGGRVIGAVTVDIDAVRRSKERGWTDPLAYMSGKVDARIVGVLRAANGKGRIELESATLGGVSVPMTVLQQLITYYTKTPESPNGFSLDQPFDLPQQIRQVDFTQRGSAVIVQ